MRWERIHHTTIIAGWRNHNRKGLYMKGNKSGQRFIEREKQLRPLMVEVRDPDRLDAALKKLKRMVKDSRIMVELQEHESFKKPSAKKREKWLRARSRARRAVLEEGGGRV